MSDPREGTSDLNPQPLPPEEPRRGVSPLIWILLLLALAALGWWYYNRSMQPGPDLSATTPTVEPAITSEQEAAAQAERERAAANDRRRSERTREAARPKAPADRDVTPIARVEPEYPAAAARTQEEGIVLVRVDVDANGMPTNVDIARRSGSRDLDRAAVEAVRQWRFNPAIKDGKKVAAVVEVPVEFKLQQQ
jgi:protein TonB